MENNPIHVISTDASKNEIKIYRLNIDYIPYIVKWCLVHTLNNLIEISINEFKIECGHSWIPSGLYGAQCVYRFQHSGKCVSKDH